MYEVVKRDGKVVDFNINKIADAIKKAFDATGTEYNDSVIDFLALKVSADFLPKIKRMWPRPTSSTASSARNCAT